ncbi:translation initiation factor IF-2-like [Rhipicephalus sanguineus]|uniref:translation initiation factor IF-2-like n=1 Tax=Rhipicephalus sanguineus TaxID=34632 RepID=UPI0020C375E4|nr:translation initiation factor IF-2-like [Rhipicephalus sanguineus]
MDKDAERRARRAAAARARRQDPEVRACEAEAHREAARRRRQDPAVREPEAASERQRRQDPAVREREAAAARQRREGDLENVRQREAARKRAYRQANPEVREREAAAKRAKKEHEGADARFDRDLLNITFGHSCNVCDRLWFSNNLITISSIRNEESRNNAIATLQRAFPAATAEDYKVCSNCKASLTGGKVPLMRVSNGYKYQPKPNLPPLNPVEERLIAPRLPFMSIRRLTHGSGQYGIKGQGVNLPINVPNTVQSLPRDIPDDVAIDVHLKRRLVSKPSYKKGLVTKSNIHA